MGRHPRRLLHPVDNWHAKRINNKEEHKMRIALLVSLSSICLFVACSNPAEPVTITPEISNVVCYIDPSGPEPDWYQSLVIVYVYGSTPHPITVRIEKWDDPNIYFDNYTVIESKVDENTTETAFSESGGWFGFVHGEQYRLVVNVYFNGDIVDTYESPEPIDI